jgi:hypothetical protein
MMNPITGLGPDFLNTGTTNFQLQPNNTNTPAPLLLFMPTPTPGFSSPPSIFTPLGVDGNSTPLNSTMLSGDLSLNNPNTANSTMPLLITGVLQLINTVMKNLITQTKNIPPAPTPSSEPAVDPPTSEEEVPDDLKDLDKKYGTMVDAAIAKANAAHPGSKLTKNYVLSEIMHESGGDPNSVGDGGTSLGLMQLNDALGISREDRMDPEKSINFAVDIMAKYNAQYDGDFNKTAMAYMTGDDLNGSFHDFAANYANDVVRTMNGD